MTVSVVGSSASSPVDGSGAFMLRGVPTGHVQLQFSANGVSAHLDLDDVADHEEIHLTVNVNGATVDVDDNDRETPDNRAEIEGRITAINVAARTLQVANKDVSVPAGTPIQHGGTSVAFADLHVGDRVHIHANRSGATIVATSIEVQTANGVAPPPDDHGHDGDNAEVELSGALSAKAGACPSITFNVGSTKVSTNGSTEFKDTSCSSLANNDVVEVKGTRQSTSSVLATRVERKSDH